MFFKDYQPSFFSFEEDENRNTGQNINKNIINETGFKPPNRELNFRHFYQNTYHFIKDIERVWTIIRGFDVVSMINGNDNYPIIVTKGNDTYNTGNEFKGKMFGLYPFFARVEKIVDLPETKTIEWLFKILNYNNCYFSMNIELYKVTEDSSTVLFKAIKFENQEIKEKFKSLECNKICDIIDKLLDREPINLVRYESAVIKGRMEEVWNLVLDLNKITAIAPNNFFPNVNLKEMKVGERREASVFNNNIIYYFDLVLKYREVKKGWNKWILAFENENGHPVKIPKNTVLFQLNKINEHESQLTILVKIYESFENSKYLEISTQLKYLLHSVKDYFENFHYSETNN